MWYQRGPKIPLSEVVPSSWSKELQKLLQSVGQDSIGHLAGKVMNSQPKNFCFMVGSLLTLYIKNKHLPDCLELNLIIVPEEGMQQLPPSKILKMLCWIKGSCAATTMPSTWNVLATSMLHNCDSWKLGTLDSSEFLNNFFWLHLLKYPRIASWAISLMIQETIYSRMSTLCDWCYVLFWEGQIIKKIDRANGILNWKQSQGK